MDKLQLFYFISNIQGTKTGYVGHAVSPPSMTFAPPSVVEATTPVPKVHQLTIILVTLFVEDPPKSHALVKRGQDKYQYSFLEEGSSKQTWLFEDIALGSATPFLGKLLFSLLIFPTLLRKFLMCPWRTYFSFKIFEEDKMYLLSEVTFHTYQAASLFSLATARRGMSWL